MCFRVTSWWTTFIPNSLASQKEAILLRGLMLGQGRHQGLGEEQTGPAQQCHSWLGAQWSWPHHTAALRTWATCGAYGHPVIHDLEALSLLFGKSFPSLRITSIPLNGNYSGCLQILWTYTLPAQVRLSSLSSLQVSTAMCSTLTGEMWEEVTRHRGWTC